MRKTHKDKAILNCTKLAKKDNRPTIVQSKETYLYGNSNPAIISFSKTILCKFLLLYKTIVTATAASIIPKADTDMLNIPLETSTTRELNACCCPNLLIEKKVK